MTAPIVVWFRNDLRLADHPALAATAKTGAPILPLYILDDATPGRLRMGGASRWWLNGSLAALDKSLRTHGGRLCLRRGKAPEVLATLLGEIGASGVYATRGYEPWEPALETAIARACQAHGAEFRLFGGRLLFEPEAILTGDGKPYRVFTPFWKACLAADPPPPPSPALKLPKFAEARSDLLDDWSLLPRRLAGGLRETWRPGEAAAAARLGAFIDNSLANYAEGRNRLDLNETSRLSPHFHFGEISPNQVWHAVKHGAESVGAPADRGAEAYLRELGWREFYYHLLHHVPTITSAPLRREFANFPWRDDPTALAAWQRGKTGYPVVDAAMRELWHTGFMHNRARMIVASFLVKHLLIPWQSGAEWFLDTLVDADLANNSASWQWVAGSGADAAPYFRVFNPVLQGMKFDPDGAYVGHWVPELAALPAPDIHAPWQAPALVLAQANVALGETYPRPIVDHAKARARALAAFATLRR